MNDKFGIKGRIVAVVENVNTGQKRIYESDNIVTTSGDAYYAALATRGQNSPPISFSAIMLGTSCLNGFPAKTSVVSSQTSSAGAIKIFTAGYPKVVDVDADNTLTGLSTVVTYLASWGTTDFAATVSSVQIVPSGASNPAPLDPVLMHATFGPVTKTSSDTLKLFVNHRFSGI